MPITSEQIRQGILHPEPFVRSFALRHFSESFSRDPSIMPEVITAVGHYGRANALPLLRDAVVLSQTEPTLNWCLDELKRFPDDSLFDGTDYRLAIAEILTHADAVSSAFVSAEILEQLQFDRRLADEFAERLHLQSLNAESLWSALEEFCEQAPSAPWLAAQSESQVQCLLRALSRTPDFSAVRVLSFLYDEPDVGDNPPRRLLHGLMIRLAGELQLRTAIPALIRQLREENEWFQDGALRALVRIGGEDVAEPLATEFPTAGCLFRLLACAVLERTHGPAVYSRCRELFEWEEVPMIRVQLAAAMLGQWAAEAVEPVRQLVLQSELDPEILELRERLLAVVTLLGVTFPEYEAWYADRQHNPALRRKYFAEQYGVFGAEAVDWNAEGLELDHLELSELNIADRATEEALSSELPVQHDRQDA